MLSVEKQSASFRVLRRAGVYGACVILSLAGVFVLRYDFAIPAATLVLLYQALGIAVPIKLGVFWFYRLHRMAWHVAGLADLAYLIFSNAVASFLFAICSLILLGKSSLKTSIYVMDFVFCLFGVAGCCFFARLIKELGTAYSSAKTEKRVLIYGAGSAGLTLLREIRANASLGYSVIGFLDDDRHKRGAVLSGVPVLGTGRSAAREVQRLRSRGIVLDEIIIALPSATGAQMQEVLANCRAAGVACKTVPGLGELLTGKVLSAQVRNIRITDLLGRKPVELDNTRIRTFIAKGAILVTGGAGSIGSEICRQVAGLGSSKVVIFDQAESDLFRIDMELRERFPGLEIVPEIGDICDTPRIDEVLARHEITHIFHAAAYKHVPMMELHPLIAIENNVIGTWNLAQAASRAGVRSFLMISSDKAVNPTNVMGASKRVAELIIASMSHSTTRFVSVRFGNVLASNGSVVGIFQDQMAKGGPLTVTHPEIRRYFMTIPEAVQLVLQASTMGHGSEIYVLDMGEPVKIVHLAESLIRLSGFTPYAEIGIRFTGLRPGEKLFEEIMTKGENILPTYHEKIKIFAEAVPDRTIIRAWLDEVRIVLQHRDAAAAVRCLTELVPEYRPSSMWSAPDIPAVIQVPSYRLVTSGSAV